MLNARTIPSFFGSFLNPECYKVTEFFHVTFDFIVDKHCCELYASFEK